MRRMTVVLLLLAIGCGGSPTLSGIQLPAGALGSPAARASFGQSVAILGGEVAVGAPLEDGGARDAGRVHVFDRFKGTLVRTLTSPVPTAAGSFGASLASADGRLLVGEPGRGRAHLLDAATGALLRTLSGPGDFGRAVALGGGYAFVGAPSRGEVSVFDADDGSPVRVFARPGAFGAALAVVGARLLAGAPSAGRAYLLDPADGREVAVLSGPGDFGAAVAAADGLCLVAAPDALRVFLHDEAGTLVRTFVAPGFAESFGTGVAYDDGHVIVGGVGAGVPSLFLFDPATGALVRTIQSTSPNEGLSFTALGGVALMGAFPTGTSPRPGLAQTFSCDSGGLLQTFTSPGNVPQGALGTSVVFVTGLTAVGAPVEGTGGLVHLFDEQGTIVRTIASPAPQSAGGFGGALAASGTTLAVGAPGESGAGRVHLFDATDGAFLRTLVPPAGSARFGFALAIDGQTIFVGSPNDNVVGGPMTFPAAGGVHPFVFDTGAPGTVQRSPNPEAQGRFGAAVAASGGQFLVGAPGEAAGQGTAYLFLGTDGSLIHTLFGSQLNAGNLGAAVAMTANDLWVGAPLEDVNTGAPQPLPGAGAVHVYDRLGGVEQTLLHSAANPFPDSHFGASLASGGGFVAIGAPDEIADPFAQVPPSGVVYRHEAQSRIRTQRFVTPAQGTNVGGFGTSVAIDAMRLAIGAPLEDRGPTAPNAGVAYLFDPNAIASLRSPQPQQFGFFGWDVAVLDADTLIIGAPTEMQGNVYLVDPTGVQPLVTIPAPDPQSTQFGWSVAAVAGNVAASSPSANLGAGEAYLFDAAGNLLQTFQSPDATATGFGEEVADLGGNVLVGSPQETVGQDTNAGRAYLFAPDGTLLQTFTSPNSELDGAFGSSVAPFGGDVLVGAPGENGSTGRAYLFATTGTLLRTLDGSEANARFGAAVGAVGAGILAGSNADIAVGEPDNTQGGSVRTFDPATGAVTGNADNPDGVGVETLGFGETFADVGGTLAVGAFIGGNARGRVYFFGAGGAPAGVLDSPNAQIGGGFGNSVAAFGNAAVVVGAPLEDVNPPGAGRAYVLGLPGQTGPVPDAIFESPAPVPGGAFGTAVAFASDVPVVGAPGEDEGVVYLFDPQTLQPDLALQSPTPVAGARFGQAIGANFLQITVGEPGGAGGAGRAYLYDATTNLLRLVFDTSFPETGGLFGASIAVTGANSVVGAPGEDVLGVANAGRAYYFDCFTEAVLQVLESPNPTDDGRFGCAVATVAFDVFVGACDEGAGNVYRFFGLSGEMLDTYPHPDPQTGAQFGFALAMAGTNLLVGAPNQIVGQADGAGIAYLIDTADGTVLQTFTKPVPAGGDRFGSAVAAMGTRIFVGAPGALQGAGEVWEFDATSGAVVARYASSNPEAGGFFGAALATIPDNGLVGAPGEDGGDADAGRVYLNPPEQ